MHQPSERNTGQDATPPAPVEASPPAPTAQPRLDPSLGVDIVADARGRLAQGDWRPAAALLARPMSPDDRSLFIDALAEPPAPGPAGESRCLASGMAEWIRERPEDPQALMVQAAHLALAGAWADCPASSIAPSPAPAPAPGPGPLAAAEASLQRAVELNPTDPSAWAYLVRTGVALGLDRGEIQRRFAQVVEAAPEHREAHSAMLQACSLKRGGSHQEMFGFVQLATLKASLGCSLHVLVAEAHIECCLIEQPKAGLTGGYFRNRFTQESITAAAQAALQPGAFIPALDSVRTRNFFAFCFWVGGLPKDAAIQFGAIGNWVTPEPWSLLGPPLEVFARAQRECGAAPVVSRAA